MLELTHFNDEGRAHMVDVGDKQETMRAAIASGRVRMKKETIKKIQEGLIKKGDVLSVAQVSAIMGTKKTSELIPMCHNILINGVEVNFDVKEDHINIFAEVKTFGRTGVEMEALTAVSMASLTIYDMCKAIDKDMVIEEVRLVRKVGGKSGEFIGDAYLGKVLSINVSAEKGEVKTPIHQGMFIEDFGLEDDAHRGKWHRQVSLLAKESFDKMKNLGVDNLHFGDFAENITTEGIIIHELPVGTKIVIGETLHEVTQIGKECHKGCAIQQKVGKCIMPKEGVFTRVLKGGIIHEGDIIKVISLGKLG